MALVVLLQVGLPASARTQQVPAADLAPNDRVLALEERGCGETETAEPHCSNLAVALGKRAASAAPRAYRDEAQVIASVLGEADNVVVVWGEALAGDPHGALHQLLAVAGALGAAWFVARRAFRYHTGT